MSLWQDIQVYLDKDSGLLMAPDGGKDNLVLFSAYLYRELIRLGEIDSANTLSDRVLSYLESNKVSLGLYRRSPGNDNSIDNLVGACFMEPSIASYTYIRWNTYSACFDCNRPEWRGFGKYWFGRFIGCSAFIRLASVGALSLIKELYWSLATFVSTYWNAHRDPTNCSDPLLQSLQVDLMDSYGYNSFACRYWRKRYNVVELYKGYFGKLHPLAVWSNK